MNDIKKLTHQTIELADKITVALEPIFKEVPDQSEAMQKAMVLITMRTIQATTHKEDWMPAARQNADLLVMVMEHGFIKDHE